MVAIPLIDPERGFLERKAVRRRNKKRSGPTTGFTCARRNQSGPALV